MIRLSLFEAALRERWPLLAPEVRALHGIGEVERFEGFARVERGESPLARFVAWCFGFPPAADRVPVIVTKIRTGGGEVWERNFGGRVFRSRLTAATTPYRVRERFGQFRFELELPVADGGMRLPVRRGWLFGVPLPRWLLPTSDSREYAEEGVFHFDVALGAPCGGGPIVRYRGWLRASAASERS